MTPDAIGVRFEKSGQVYHYRTGAHADQIRLGDFVVVDAKDGYSLGQVVSFGLPPNWARADMKTVKRRATPRELLTRQWYRAREADALLVCRESVRAERLAFKAIRGRFSAEGKHYTLEVLPADESQEKLELGSIPQRIGQQYKASVAVRKIGPREVSQIAGDYGLCGDVRCSVLMGIRQVSINMAKDQGILPNQPDAVGLCGRLRCCLRFEAEQYHQARKDFPKVGAQAQTPQGLGKIIALDVLNEIVMIEIGEGEETAVIRMLLTELEESDPAACPRCQRESKVASRS